MKKPKSQISLRDVVSIVRSSKIPWGWVLLTFLMNMYYNRILFKLPGSTGRLLSGDLSGGALQEALLSYGAYAVCVVVQALIKAWTYSVTTRRARFQLWGRMLKIRESYFDRVDSSEMLSAVSYDISGAMGTVVNLLVAVVPDLIYVGRALAQINEYDPILLVVVIAFLPMKYLYSVVIGRRVYQTEAKVRSQVGLLVSRIGERLDNLALIKTFNKEEAETEIGGEYIQQLYEADVAVAKLGGISLALEQGIELGQQFITMIIAVILLQQGKIDISQWIAFFLFSSNLSSKFATLIEDWMDVKSVSGNLERTNRLYHAPTEEENPDGTPMDTVQDYTLALEQVSFRYEGDQALSDVSVTIPQGQKAAIVGSCGSGKSTTLALLERFYAPDSGRVTLGGVPVEQFPLHDYRRTIAYVPQQNSVFSGTIREALLYGNREAVSEEAIHDAAERTGFDAYLALRTEGLEAEVRDGGAMMSGGQLQKLIITRELLRRAKIVLLDEPTSALDAQSGLAIRDLILRDLKEQTVVVVTHDMTVAQPMEQIIVLDDGHLVDSGTYDELLERCPTFRTLVESQKNGEVSA